MVDLREYHERRARQERAFAERVSQCADRDAHIALAEMHEAAAASEGSEQMSSGET